MKKIFLLTVIITSFIACNNDSEKKTIKIDNEPVLGGELGPIVSLFIRLVDSEGNWIDRIGKKELKLFVADSNWNILEEQPNNAPGIFYDHSLWWTGKCYNNTENGKEKELLYIEIVTFLGDLRYYDYINDKNYGDYIVLQIDENTSINIQLFYKEFYNHSGLCIEKFICNDKEYVNLEIIPDYHYGKGAVAGQKINDIVIE